MTIMQNIRQEDYNHVFAVSVLEYIQPIIQNSKPGHCQRISTLPEAVMMEVANKLNSVGLDADIVYVLSPRQQSKCLWQISSARLIELRNQQKRPLLAFIPPGLKAANEDSFDISTFAEIDLSKLSSTIRRKIREEFPDELGILIDRVIKHLEKNKDISDEDVIRYYLAIQINKLDKSIAGGAIFHLGLIPDYGLYEKPNEIEQRIAHNITLRNIIIDDDNSLLFRIHNLSLKANTIQADLFRFLRVRRLFDVKSWACELATSPEFRNLCFDKWPFSVEQGSKILVFVDDLDLPAKESDKAISADNPQYLDLYRANFSKSNLENRSTNFNDSRFGLFQNRDYQYRWRFGSLGKQQYPQNIIFKRD